MHYESSTIDKPEGIRTPAATIRFAELPRLMGIFGELVDVTTGTKAVESCVSAGYDENQILDVLYSVIVTFGGGWRIWGKWHRLYAATPQQINSTLAEVHRQRDGSAENLRALLRGIKGLGGLAYSTKMLRFISPNHVVLDSILREEFGMGESDYAAFADHCRKIGATLNVNAVDVESALYTYVQLNNPNQRNAGWKRFQPYLPS